VGAVSLAFLTVLVLWRFGLAVVGYSGRDQSIIDALTDAIDGGSGYPGVRVPETRSAVITLRSCTRG
jgi:hypothetical protein